MLCCKLPREKKTLASSGPCRYRDHFFTDPPAIGMPRDVSKIFIELTHPHHPSFMTHVVWFWCGSSKRHRVSTYYFKTLRKPPCLLGRAAPQSGWSEFRSKFCSLCQLNVLKSWTKHVRKIVADIFGPLSFWRINPARIWLTQISKGIPHIEVRSVATRAVKFFIGLIRTVPKVLSRFCRRCSVWK